MSMYTTGEMAKLCGITVRTVQYYDARGILIPSELSEGGRRLYSDEDLRRLRVICFLRGLDFSIDDIGALLKEEHPENVISMLIEQQEQSLKEELKERQDRLSTLHGLKSELKNIEGFSVDSIGDIAHIMKNKKKFRKLRMAITAVGIPLDILEVAALVLWILKGIWLPFVAIFVAAIVIGLIAAKLYIDRIAFICPECHSVFRQTFGKVMFASHTPYTRRLECIHCGHNGFCVETYYDKGESKND